MRYRTVFFDRDSTLIYRDPAVAAARDSLFQELTGVGYGSDGDASPVVDEACYPSAFFLAHRDDESACIEEERAFWRRFYEIRLRRCGLQHGVAAAADRLHELTWLKGIVPYPDAVPTLEFFSALRFRMGVISDTSPSLRMTVEAAGLGGYFSSYTCSDLVGVMKPDPRIYLAALASLGARAGSSMYEDDYWVESDGARTVGMTAFHILRDGLDRGYEGERERDIHSLTEMTEYVRGQGAQ